MISVQNQGARENTMLNSAIFSHLKMLLIPRGMFFLCAVITAMLLCGCNADTMQTEQIGQEWGTIRLKIDVATGTVKNGKLASTRVFSYGFEGDNMIPIALLKEGEIEQGLCIIRNDNPKIPQRCVPVEWIVRGGKLWCESFTANMDYPKEEILGKWQACFFLGHGEYDEKQQRVKFTAMREARLIDKKNQQWHLPYLSEWLPLETADAGHLRTPYVKFTPQGAFISMRVVNDTRRNITVSSLRMKATDPSLHSAPFVWDGVWQTDDRGTEAELSPVLSSKELDFVCPLLEPITLKAGETSGWYGLWVMPIGKQKGYSTDVYIVPTDGVDRRQPWWLYHTPLEGMSSIQGPISGRSYTLSLRLRQVVHTTLANWMQDMEDDRLVCKMSIPGTHDTGAWTGNMWVKTQDKNIKEQLASGIRFFDIRLVLDGDLLKLCHSFFIFDRTFHKDILSTTADFLREHPSETVIMTIKRDHDKDKDGGERYRQAVKNVLAADPSIQPYIAGAFSPGLTMGDLRGKMLILSREGWYSTNSGWIERWSDNKQFSTTIISTNDSRTMLNVEDTYKCSAEDKVKLVRENMLKANDAYGSITPKWFVTFSSYTGPKGLGAPYVITKNVDPYVNDILRGNDNLLTCGILLFNFAGWYDNRLTNSVIRLNYIGQPPLVQ